MTHNSPRHSTVKPSDLNAHRRRAIRRRARLVAFADLAVGSYVLDAGCGPGLVCEAFLSAGHRMFGVDLSPEMIARAERRCERFGNRARFVNHSVFDQAVDAAGPFDVAVSRFVLHHVVDPAAFLGRQMALVRPGGALILCDHTTDTDPARAEEHNLIERLRDTTHTSNHTSGGIVDLFARLGLVEVRCVEERFTLDFDEWFDRGTPASPKATVRDRLLSGPHSRGFRPELLDDGSVRIACVRCLVRGVKP